MLALDHELVHDAYMLTHTHARTHARPGSVGQIPREHLTADAEACMQLAVGDFGQALEHGLPDGEDAAWRAHGDGRGKNSQTFAVSILSISTDFACLPMWSISTDFLELSRRRCARPSHRSRAGWHTFFSKVLYVATLHSKYTRPLTFQNFGVAQPQGDDLG
jgi:hypothetical protein